MRLLKQWTDFIHRSALNKGQDRKYLTYLMGSLYVGSIAFLIYLSFECDRFFSLHRMLPKGFRFGLGLPILTVGLMFWVWCAVIFLKKKGTPVPVKPPPTLVSTGPYAYTRNPMLTGIFLFMFGTGLIAGSVSLVFIFTPAFIFFNFLELKLIEEPELEMRLGADYREYKKTIPMFFPKISSRTDK